MIQSCSPNRSTTFGFKWHTFLYGNDVFSDVDAKLSVGSSESDSILLTAMNKCRCSDINTAKVLQELFWNLSSRTEEKEKSNSVTFLVLTDAASVVISKRVSYLTQRLFTMICLDHYRSFGSFWTLSQGNSSSSEIISHRNEPVSSLTMHRPAAVWPAVSKVKFDPETNTRPLPCCGNSDFLCACSSQGSCHGYYSYYRLVPVVSQMKTLHVVGDCYNDSLSFLSCVKREYIYLGRRPVDSLRCLALQHPSRHEPTLSKRADSHYIVIEKTNWNWLQGQLLNVLNPSLWISSNECNSFVAFVRHGPISADLI